MTEPLIDRIIRRQAWMEPVSDGLQKAVGGFYSALGRPGRTLKNLMHGTYLLGHPLHPALTDVPIGAWAVGVVADYAAVISSRVPTEAGNLALGIGVAGAVLAAVTGLTDFHETFGQERRYGLAHGLLMTLALLVDAISLALRVWAGSGAHGLAVALATIGFVVAIGSAWLGGHLVFGIGTMVNRGAFLEGPEEFVPVGAPADFAEGEMRCVDAGGMNVLLTRSGGRLCAIADVCSHAGGPLHEGALLEGGVVECPWHQSRFRLSDGRAVGGPATFSQTALQVREQDGQVEVRLEHPLH